MKVFKINQIKADSSLISILCLRKTVSRTRVKLEKRELRHDFADCMPCTRDFRCATVDVGARVPGMNESLMSP